MTTSTAGWRTLRQYRRISLLWLEDLDQDGEAELIIWDSFPLKENASMAEYGLVAWVYRLASKDLFTFFIQGPGHRKRQNVPAKNLAQVETRGYVRQTDDRTGICLRGFMKRI